MSERPKAPATWQDGTPIYTYVGVCCREWTLALGVRPGRCGLRGERPVPKEEA